jgi:hypothetical protein
VFISISEFNARNGLDVAFLTELNKINNTGRIINIRQSQGVKIIL